MSTDTLELIDLEALLGDLKVPCIECDEPATWEGSHGSATCRFYWCTEHRDMIVRWMNEDKRKPCTTDSRKHKHFTCRICQDNFSGWELEICPWSQPS